MSGFLRTTEGGKVHKAHVSPTPAGPRVVPWCRRNRFRASHGVEVATGPATCEVCEPNEGQARGPGFEAPAPAPPTGAREDRTGVAYEPGDWVLAPVAGVEDRWLIGRVIQLPDPAAGAGVMRVQGGGEPRDVDFDAWSSEVLLRADGSQPKRGAASKASP